MNCIRCGAGPEWHGGAQGRGKCPGSEGNEAPRYLSPVRPAPPAPRRFGYLAVWSEGERNRIVLNETFQEAVNLAQPRQGQVLRLPVVADFRAKPVDI